MYGVCMYDVCMYGVCMYGVDLHSVIERPTRITRNSHTLRDNIFNQAKYSVRSGLLINDICDHLPTFALCNYEIEKRKECDTFNHVRL